MRIESGTACPRRLGGATLISFFLTLATSSCSEDLGVTPTSGTLSIFDTTFVYYVPDNYRTSANGLETVTIDFEGSQSGLPDTVGFRIDPRKDVYGATLGGVDDDSIWSSVVDRDVVELSGAHFANPPSPTRAVQNFGMLKLYASFDPPVRSVTFMFTGLAVYTYTLRAYNSAGFPVEVVSLPGPDDEQTPESPWANVWAPIGVDAGSDMIASITFSGVSSQGFSTIPILDDLVFTREATCNNIFPAPTGDPVLDSPQVQEALYNALVEGGAFDPDIEARMEEGGYIYERPDGSFYGVRTENPAKQTACTVTIGGPTTAHDPSDTVRAAYHTHPFSHRGLLPASCGYGTTARYNAKGSGGGLSDGSTGDWQAVENDGIPHYVIDLDKVYRGDPGTPPSQRQSIPNWPWNQNSCN